MQRLRHLRNVGIYVADEHIHGNDEISCVHVIILDTMMAKAFLGLDSTPSVVENVLGQLTESRGTNEDRR